MHFDVLSSDGSTIYQVTVAVSGADVRASCTCRAGELGKLCRHQVGILLGRVGLLASPSRDATVGLERLVSEIAHTACANYVAEITAAEAELRAQKMRLDRAKRNLEKLLKQHSGPDVKSNASY